MKKFEITFCTVVLGAVLCGCKDTDYEGVRLVDKYHNQSMDNAINLTVYGNALIKHSDERRMLDVMEPNCERFSSRICYVTEERLEWVKLAKKAFLSGMEKNDANIIVNLPAMVNLDEFELTKTQSEQFVEFIKFSSGDKTLSHEGLAASYSYIGRLGVEKGEYFEAYKHFADAVAISNYKGVYAKNVIALLDYFGCKQDTLVWSEFTTGSNLNVVIKLRGARYPEQDIDIGFNLALARLAIRRMVDVPQLQNSCPINLYKN